MSKTTVPQVNLIPRERIELRQRKQWTAWWITTVVIVAFVIGVPGLYIGGSAALTDSGMADQIEHANMEYANHQQAIPLLRERIRVLDSEQEVYELVKNRIEWMDVFSVLVEAAGNDIRFSRLSAVGGGIEGKSPIEISIVGIAPSQTIAREFVVKLEETGVFDSVELVRTTREKVDDTELIDFQVRITIRGTAPVEEEGKDGE